MEQILDLIIIGDGPAGLSAAIKAASASLNFVVLDGSDYIGGRMNMIPEIEDFPSMYSISGTDLAAVLYQKAITSGVSFHHETVEFVELTDHIKTVITDENEYAARAVIFAAGMSPKSPDHYNKHPLPLSGVCFDAKIHADTFADKTIAIAGNSRMAIQSAIYMSDIATTVYLISKSNALTASKPLQERLFEIPNIHFIPGFTVGEIIGEEQVEAAWIENVVTKEQKTLAIDGIILPEEFAPNSQLVDNQLNINYAGYILAKEDCRTSLELVYAAGDVRNKPMHSIISAINDGQAAIDSLLKDLNK